MLSLYLVLLVGILYAGVANVALGSVIPGRQRSPHAPRPLVLWHGLGDSYASPGMLEFMQLVKEVHPDIFIHSVYLDENLEEDRKAGWFGNMNDRVARVSEQIESVPELAGGFDAMGFSQGGQFLRAYVERYNSPPVHNLITFGSQHMGIADIPGCTPYDIPCQLARRAALGGVYTTWAQENLVQAQYFRDTKRMDAYLGTNTFLTSINNELAATRNETYRQNFISLNKLVLIIFSEDKTVVPKESSWFGSYAYPETNGTRHDETIVPMRLQPLYNEDWIGLRTLDERGDVVLETCEGAHMQLTADCWKPIVKRFVGGKQLHDSLHDDHQLIFSIS